jgi:uncharacterized membrane protein (UPF0127 family)
VVEARTADRGTVLGGRVQVADRWWLRLRGLLGRAGLADGEGLLIEPCRAVHMAGMKFPIDVAFLSRDGDVVALYSDLAPGARTAWHRGARSALELPAGTLAATGTRQGDVILCATQEQP